MPARFDGAKKGGDDSGKDLIHVPEAWTEPRCHVCMSTHRKAIERMIALGTGHTEISRIFGGEIDRRSITSHAEKHLNYEEAAIRQIIQRETHAAEENAEEGISGVTKRRVYLETALHKALAALQGEKVVVEPKDAVTIIEALNRFDHQTSGAQVDEIKIQFQAFLQAIREVAAQRNDPSLGSDILIRAREIVGTQVPEPRHLNP